MNRPTSFVLVAFFFLIFCQQSALSFVPIPSTTTANSGTQLYAWFQNNNPPSKKKSSEKQIPYVIERIGGAPKPPQLYSEIADLCIDVFFKERLGAKPKDSIPPWKEVQINYLKALQTSDLKVRRARYPHSNEMFLAYEVKAATSKKDYLSKPLVLDLDSVYHKRQLLADSSSSSSKDVDFVKGDLIGFVEITQRAYGLGDTVSSDDSDMLRPVLTNLAVRHDARKSGIGSKLLDVCEQHIVKNWNMNECVLEVEDYNTRANKWYQNRGYRVLFSDPAARRYDVSGVVLKKVRGQRDIMRKVLTLQQAQQADSETLSVSKAYSRILAQLRETVGV